MKEYREYSQGLADVQRKMQAYAEHFGAVAKGEKPEGPAPEKADLLDIREHQATWLAKWLSRELPMAERASVSLTMPQIAEALDACEASCFPITRLCAECGEDLDGEPDGEDGG